MEYFLPCGGQNCHPDVEHEIKKGQINHIIDEESSHEESRWESYKYWTKIVFGMQW